MGPTHHLVTNVRFRKTKSTVSVKSVSEHATAPRIKASVNSVYNSSEIDKIRYCQPNRWTEKGGPTARAEPEVVFRGTITFNYLVLVLIRYIIVVKLIKPVIAYPTDRKEGLRPVTTCPENLHRPGLIRPTGSQGQSRVFGPIGSIPRSIADTRNIIVVKLIKSVIAHPADRKEGLWPV